MMVLLRRIWLPAFVGMVITSLVGVGYLFWPRPKFNVLLVTLDTTRADHIGCYGYPQALTPTLDALAGEGVLFENAYATVPLTLPSHASMLTGLYPPENGIHINGRGPLGDDVPTLAGLLQQSGYATGAFVGAVVLYGKSGLHRGFDVYDDDMAGGERHGHESHLMRSGRIVVDSALSWLNRIGQKPFFCWVHLYDPHAPFEGHATEFGDRFRDQPYDGDIAFADLQVGRLIKHLQEKDLYDRTLILVVGDHGEGFGEHEELEHGFLLYNATLRVPLIATCPARFDRNRRVASAVSLVDLMPTILASLGISQPKGFSGVDLCPSLRGESQPLRACYSETEACYAAYRWAPLASVTTDRWKFINAVSPELYDLHSDPRELNNLAESHPALLEELRQELTALRQGMQEASATDVKHDAQHLQQLRALGYVSGGSPVEPEEATGSEVLPDVKDRIGYYNAEVAARQLLKTDPEAAIQELRRITSEVPNFLPAWLTLGTALQTVDRLDEAIAAYQAALAANPQEADVHFDLGKLYASAGQRDKAIEHYEEVLKLDPYYAMAHVNLASLLADQGETSAARRHFELGLEEFPDSTVARFNFGLFLYRLGEYQAAIPHLARAVELDPRLPQVHFQLGLALAAVDDMDEAAERFETTLRLNPRHAAAAEQLRKLAQRREQL